MKSAFSMSLNRLFLADHYAINYQSYDRLHLTCDECGESVFFKKGSDFNKSGIKKAAHFSHYQDTEKNGCGLRTESYSNLRYIDDSEGKKQSLEKFHEKIQKIINLGIIRFKNIKFSELECYTSIGESLVIKYNINIELWLSRFYKKREHFKNQAFYLYHNKSSERQSRFFSNIVHYLCLPANEHILKKILYYVFVFNKEIFINNNLDEVFSKVIELISHINLENEYRQGNNYLMDFNNITESVLPEQTNLEKETVKSNMVINDDLFVIELHYDLCIRKESKSKNNQIVYRGEILYQETYYKTIRKKIPPKISIKCREDKEGQYLTLWNNTTIVATFYLTTDGIINWYPLPKYFVSHTFIARPLNLYPEFYMEIKNYYDFFAQWVNSGHFKDHITKYAGDSFYPPQFVRLLCLFIAYINERLNLTKLTGDGLTREVNINFQVVYKNSKDLLRKLIGNSKAVKKRFRRWL
jgi:hypothetical protein